MLLAVVATAALAVDGPADVTVTRTFTASPEAIHAVLDDWHDWQAILPPDCATDWQIYEPSTGVGAQSEATYTFGPLRRHRYGAIQRDEPGVVFETEHLGNRGWFTQVQYHDLGDGRTEVTLRTPLSEPKWPFRGVFYKKVRPAWVGCYERAMTALDGRIAAGG
ncbi:MAG: hypothetical protein R3F59_19640 [Myxococcota bacterium]